MGILKGIFKSRDKPKNATSGSAYRFFIGGSSIGKNVNERSAMQMTAVYLSWSVHHPCWCYTDNKAVPYHPCPPSFGLASGDTMQ